MKRNNNSICLWRTRLACVELPLAKRQRSTDCTRAACATNQHRRGTSLIHMLVVITSLGFLTTAVITTMVSMMRAQGRAAGVWVMHHQWLQLTDDWRRDAHAALSAEITLQDNVPTFVLQSAAATHRVTYVANKNEVIRRETDGDKLVRTETYRLPNWNVRFEADAKSLTTNQPAKLICQHPNSPRPTPTTPVPLREDTQLAVIGRDHRFEKTSSETETKKPESL
ncbi:MAG: hypothetical protein NT013_17200 [Planctomycetia bacterium]|nr:hypothetical protein [Planctomycetia bacterium]